MFEVVAVEHLADVRRVDRMLIELRPRIVAAVAVSETTVTDVYRIGAVMAAYVLGYTGDVRRFASKDTTPDTPGRACYERKRPGRQERQRRDASTEAAYQRRRLRQVVAGAYR